MYDYIRKLDGRLKDLSWSGNIFLITGSLLVGTIFWLVLFVAIPLICVIALPISVPIVLWRVMMGERELSQQAAPGAKAPEGEE